MGKRNRGIANGNESWPCRVTLGGREGQVKEVGLEMNLEQIRGEGSISQ